MSPVLSYQNYKMVKIWKDILKSTAGYLNVFEAV